MAQEFNPRFDLSKTYTKDEFIFRFECLMCSSGGGKNAQMMAKNIAWAKSLPDDTVFGFQIGEDKSVTPIEILIHTPIKTRDSIRKYVN